MTVTMQAIPPCMLKKGSAAQGQCLIEAANAISKEMNVADRDSGLEIVKKCKCDAFTKMLSSLVTVTDMICVEEVWSRCGGQGGGSSWWPAWSTRARCIITTTPKPCPPEQCSTIGPKPQLRPKPGTN